MKKAIQPVNNEKSVKKPSNAFGKGFFTSFVICLVCISMFFAGVYFNISNLKTYAIKILKIEQTQLDLIAQKQADLDTANKYLEDSLTKLTQDQAQLKKDTEAIELQKVENEKTTVLLSSEKLKIEKYILIYEAMEPQKVADILAVDAQSEQVLTVLKNMDQKKVAVILSLMTPAAASKILAKIAS